MSKYRVRLLRRTYFCLMLLTGFMVGLNMAVHADGLPWVPPALAFTLANLCAWQAIR